MKSTQQPDDRPTTKPIAAGDVHRAALAYAARGWSVIPIEGRGKRPLLAWLEFQRRIAAPGEIDVWFRRWPDANVAIVTGRVSGVVVVDVDPRHGGQESLDEIEREHGALPPSVEVATGGGGRHLYFAPPSQPLHNRVGVRPGIDLRADGGCVVAPPSMHASGRRYAWAPGHGPDEVALAELPPAFLDRPQSGARSSHSPMHWRQLVRDGVGEGARNATLASLTGHLLRRDVDAQVALELLLAWNRMRCQPPLPDAEVARVVQSIARLHEREREGRGPD